MIRAVAAVLYLASATTGLAETALFAFGFGDDVVEAFAGDILSAQTSLDDNARPALSVRLNPRFDVLVSNMTGRHVGEVGYFRVCDTVLSEPRLMEQIPLADFQINGIDLEEATRFAAMINDASCGIQPSS